MTLRLILTRHAKSAWDDPTLDDHDRVLNKRGQASASIMGEWLVAQGYVPDQVLCSSAARTQETWARIAAQFEVMPDIQFLPSLYLAEPEIMLEELKNASGHTVMMIAHNPGSAQLADGLAMSPPPDDRFHRYPTCATTILDFDAEQWADVGWSSGYVTDFMVPRDLL